MSASSSSHILQISAASSGAMVWSGAWGNSPKRSSCLRVRSTKACPSANVIVPVCSASIWTFGEGIYRSSVVGFEAVIIPGYAATGKRIRTAIGTDQRRTAEGGLSTAKGTSVYGFMRLFFHVAALTFWLYPGVFPPKVNDVIFINHQKSSKAAKDYYTQHIAPGDGRYYTEENAQQMKGVWHGRGAEMLQLSGEVKQEDFFRLCDNLTPDGKKLTARTDTDRRVMTDVTFDCSKSVTLAYELGGDDRILTAFRESVRETMAEMEANVQTRVRKNGADHDR